MASKAPCVEVQVIATKGQGEADVVSSPNEPWHVPALKTCCQCKMKGPDWSIRLERSCAANRRHGFQRRFLLALGAWQLAEEH